MWTEYYPANLGYSIAVSYPSNHLMALHRQFFTKEFWVHFHNLPLSCMNQKMGKNRANTVDLFKACEVHEDGSGWGTVLRVLIELEIHKPIARSRTINVQGNRLWTPPLMKSFSDCASSAGVSPMATTSAMVLRKTPTQYKTWLCAAINQRRKQSNCYTRPTSSFSEDTSCLITSEKHERRRWKKPSGFHLKTN